MIKKIVESSRTIKINLLCSLGMPVSETTWACIDTSDAFYYVTVRKRLKFSYGLCYTTLMLLEHECYGWNNDYHAVCPLGFYIFSHSTQDIELLSP